MLEHGDRVQDKITGLKGIVVGITTWLYGCRRLSIQPETLQDGKPAEMYIVDEPQLTLLKKGVIKPIEQPHDNNFRIRRHGPRENVSQRTVPSRY